ncbi:MFS transporter [Winogradskya humida]|uniref:MFS transporter n=1 Tax=Winogradskya humida TaxID=113566 RepID=A0ABQ4A293_9ACTN|nr:MFS transporter [Actinoplanes humidus]GIE24975.1 MFS transporter [Actinoplanes humidus]
MNRTTQATIGFAAAAMLVSYLPFSAINGVLATISADTASLQWVTDAFTVALTGAVLSGGALAERYGRRRITVAGLALTVLGCLVGSVAGGVHVLWVGQAVAGAGAGLVMSATLALIAATADSAAARTRAIALWAAANVAGLGAGPFLAAAVPSWRWLFPPVAVLAAAVAGFGLLRSREVVAGSPGRPDLLGQLTGTTGVIALVFGVIRAGSDGWTDAGALLGLTGGVVVLAAFLLVEQRAANPVLRPALFAARGFTAAGAAAGAALFTMIGVVFVTSLALAQQDVGNLGIAARLGCLFAGNAIASIVAGRLQVRLGSTTVLLGGLVVALAGLTALLGSPFGTGFGDLAWRLIVVGAGCGTVIATSTAVAVQSVAGPLAGMAGTANNVIRQLGAALGTAVLGGVLASRLAGGSSLVTALHGCVAVLLVVMSAAAVTAAALLLIPRTATLEGEPA